MKLESFEPMAVARLLKAKVFSNGVGRPLLIKMGVGIWGFSDGRWRELSRSDLLDVLNLQLERAYREVKSEAGIARKYWSSLSGFLRRNEEVMRCLETLVKVEGGELPMWLDAEMRGRFPADKCVAFRDRVVCVHGGRKRMVDRDERFFCSDIVDVEYGDGKGDCPLWKRCLVEWMPRDEGGRELLQRWFGYLMIHNRGYQRGLLHLGKVRSGKGTCTDVAKRLVGDARYHGRTLEDLAGPWGMEGFHRGGLLVVSEVSELTRMEAQRITKHLKQCIGQDTVMIPEKYGRNKHGVRLKLAPWICGNEMPGLSNRGQGLSGKLLPLKFNVSFLGKENVDLGRQLASEEEMRGIALWALEGALALEAADPHERWPKSAEGDKVIDEFLEAENPYEKFLRSQFVEKPGGFVANSRIRNLWRGWWRNMGDRPPGGSDLHLPKRLVDEGSWNLELAKRDATRGVSGLAIRRDAKRTERDPNV